jgi:hypothetical protein
MALVNSNWGRTGTPGTFIEGDYNFDGVVNVFDLGLVLARWYED